MTEQLAALKKLRVPFEEHQINLLPRPYKKDSPKGKCAECGGFHALPAVHLKFVGHAALTDRLLDVDPTWSWEPVAFGADGLPLLDQQGGMWIRLTVCGVTRLGYGDAQGKTGPDAMKERIGDALRNAAMRFGAALDLWHKGDLHKDEEPEEEIVSDNGMADFKLAIREADDLISLQNIGDGIGKSKLSGNQRNELMVEYTKRKKELKTTEPA